jgi:hypothetical protein
VGLPGRGFHDLGECGTLHPLQQCQDCGGFAALANTRSLRLGAFLGALAALLSTNPPGLRAPVMDVLTAVTTGQTGPTLRLDRRSAFQVPL